jgi:hypothetical protein
MGRMAAYAVMLEICGHAGNQGHRRIQITLRFEKSDHF